MGLAFAEPEGDTTANAAADVYYGYYSYPTTQRLSLWAPLLVGRKKRDAEAEAEPEAHFPYAYGYPYAYHHVAHPAAYAPAVYHHGNFLFLLSQKF